MSNACILVSISDNLYIDELIEDVEERLLGDVDVFVLTNCAESVEVARNSSLKIERIFLGQGNRERHMSFARSFLEVYEKVIIIEDKAKLPARLFKSFDQIEDLGTCVLEGVEMYGSGKKILSFQELKDDIFCRCAAERATGLEGCVEEEQIES